jgi:hypothetical protein
MLQKCHTLSLGIVLSMGLSIGVGVAMA